MDDEMTIDEALAAAGALMDEIRAAELLCTEEELAEVVAGLLRAADPQARRWLSVVLLEAELEA